MHKWINELDSSITQRKETKWEDELINAYQIYRVAVDKFWPENLQMWNHKQWRKILTNGTSSDITDKLNHRASDKAPIEEPDGVSESTFTGTGVPMRKYISDQ